jgi:phage baseplate assembly protein V
VSASLLEALGVSDRPERQRFAGLFVAIVTNNQDPEKLGRIRLKFPWLSDTDESDWVRVAAPMAGNDRGVFFLPEVGDEVLVGFVQGDMHVPIVLGGLWGGKDKPPATNEDGKNNLRLVKSRSGHVIRLDDTDGAEKIEVIDKSGKNSVTIDTQSNTITIKAVTDLVLEAENGKVSIKGASVEVTATKQGVKVEGQTTVDVNGTQQVNVKGGTVNLN